MTLIASYSPVESLQEDKEIVLEAVKQGATQGKSRDILEFLHLDHSLRNDPDILEIVNRKQTER